MTCRPLKRAGKEFIECGVDDAEYVEFLVPSDIFEYRRLKIGEKPGKDIWSWNGNIDEPTFRPSVLSTASWAGKPFKCHSYITKGIVHFLNDCTHKYAGQYQKLRSVDE